MPLYYLILIKKIKVILFRCIGWPLWQDTGFQGPFPEYITINMPIKKPKR